MRQHCLSSKPTPLLSFYNSSFRSHSAVNFSTATNFSSVSGFYPHFKKITTHNKNCFSQHVIKQNIFDHNSTLSVRLRFYSESNKTPPKNEELKEKSIQDILKIFEEASKNYDQKMIKAIHSEAKQRQNNNKTENSQLVQFVLDYSYFEILRNRHIEAPEQIQETMAELSELYEVMSQRHGMQNPATIKSGVILAFMKIDTENYSEAQDLLKRIVGSLSQVQTFEHWVLDEFSTAVVAYVQVLKQLGNSHQACAVIESAIKKIEKYESNDITDGCLLWFYVVHSSLLRSQGKISQAWDTLQLVGTMLENKQILKEYSRLSGKPETILLAEGKFMFGRCLLNMERFTQAYNFLKDSVQLYEEGENNASSRLKAAMNQDVILAQENMEYAKDLSSKKTSMMNKLKEIFLG